MTSDALTHVGTGVLRARRRPQIRLVFYPWTRKISMGGLQTTGTSVNSTSLTSG